MAKIPATEMVRLKAWNDWRDKDYTWNGLAKLDARFGHPVPSHPWTGWTIVRDGENEYAIDIRTGRRYGALEAEPLQSWNDKPRRAASLQDFWRADPGTGVLFSNEQIEAQLIRRPGQPTYHKVHLPDEYEDRTPTGKANWSPNQLDGLLGPRLSLDDHKAWLDGGVLLSAPNFESGLPYIGPVSFEYAIFIQPIEFSKAAFSRSVSFQSATFTNMVGFIGTAFDEDANFERANFAQEAIFLGANFSGLAKFQSATFAGDVDFDQCVFRGRSIFEGANFNAEMSFKNTKFSGKASFYDLTWPPEPKHFYKAFSKSSFEATVDFGGQSFPKFIALSDTRFASSVNSPVLIDSVAKRNWSDQLDQVKKFAKLKQRQHKHDKNNRLINDRDILSEFEAGIKLFRLSSSAPSDRSESADILQIIEYRTRRANPKVNIIDRFVLLFVDFVCEFGTSIFRPIFSLGVIILIGAAFYAIWSIWHGVNYSGVDDGIAIIQESIAFSLRISTNVVGGGPAEISQLGGDRLWVKNVFKALSPQDYLLIKSAISMQYMLSLISYALIIVVIQKKFGAFYGGKPSAS